MNAKHSLLIGAAFIALGTAGAATQDTLRLSLRQAMDTARAAAVSVQLAHSRSAEMGAQVGEARGALLPRIGATATDAVRSVDLPAQGFSDGVFGPNTPPLPNYIAPFNSQDLRANASLSLVDVSAWKRYEASRREQEVSQWDEQAASEEALMAAAAAYLQLARTRAVISARDSELSMAEQLDTLTRAQKRAGSLTRIEVLRAAGQLSSAQSARAAAGGEEEQARYALLRLLGLNMATYPQLTDSLSLTSLGNADAGTPDASLLNAAVSSRPEVISAQKQAEAAQAQLGALRAGYLPTLNVAGDYGLIGRRLDGNAEWTEDFVVQLNWNLWDGGLREAKQGQQHERLRQAEIRQRDARAGVEEDFRSSAAVMQASQEQAAHALERVRFAEEEARLSQDRFAAGASGNLEVITAQNSLSLAHDGYIDALYGYNRARLAFLRAAHRLSDF